MRSKTIRWLMVLPLAPIVLLGLFRLAAMLREHDDRRPADVALFATPHGAVAAALAGPPDGRPVLIVPGTIGWSGFWRDVSAHLARRGYRVIAADLPPFGWSDRDPGARYDRTTQAARLASLLRQAAPNRPAIVLAHSFGAGAATELALRAPGRVGGLVLVDAALGALDPASAGPTLAARLLARPTLGRSVLAATLTNPWAIGPLARSMLARKEAAAAWRETLRAPMRRSGTTAAYAAWAPQLFAADDGAWSRRSARLSAIRMPVAILWGAADTVTLVAQGEALARLLRARRLTRLPGLGHVPHIENPALFRSALDAAIEDLDA